MITFGDTKPNTNIMKAVGIISIIYGSLVIIYGIFSLLMISVYANLIRFIPELDAYMYGFDLEAYMFIILGVLKILMPLAIVVGAIYLWGGIGAVRKVSSIFQLRLAAILNIIWYLLYIYLFLTRILPFLNGLLFDFDLGPLFNIIFIFAFLIGAIFYCGYPVFLLIWLRKERT